MLATSGAMINGSSQSRPYSSACPSAGKDAIGVAQVVSENGPPVSPYHGSTSTAAQHAANQGKAPRPAGRAPARMARLP